MSTNDRNRQPDNRSSVATESDANQSAGKEILAFSEWIDQSLAKLVEQHIDFVTKKSTRTFFHPLTVFDLILPFRDQI